MKYIVLPEGRRRLPFYLATEEFAARYLSPDDDYFFMWIVEPTVIIGRHQLLDTEVNTDYCRANGIDIVRRKSGGGCVYSDLRNVMMSYITASGADTAATFAAYTAKVAALLRSLGLDAEAGSRNDVTIGPERRKVSGGAFYRIGNRSIAHGTMLYSVDTERMAAALTPSAAKLRSKGIESVRSRVTCITRYRPDLSLDEFMARARSFMTDSDVVLTPDDLGLIAQIEEPYYTDMWLHGHDPRGSASFSKRIEGAGDFDVTITTRGGNIDSRPAVEAPRSPLRPRERPRRSPRLRDRSVEGDIRPHPRQLHRPAILILTNHTIIPDHSHSHGNNRRNQNHPASRPSCEARGPDEPVCRI